MKKLMWFLFVGAAACSMLIFSGCAALQTIAHVGPPNCQIPSGERIYSASECARYAAKYEEPKKIETQEQPQIVQQYNACADMQRWVVNPMSLAGQTCVMRFRVQQVVDGKNMLLDIEGVAELSAQPSLFYAKVQSTEGIVDGERIAVLGNIDGTQSYVTALGTTSTVPRLLVRHITVQNY